MRRFGLFACLATGSFLLTVPSRAEPIVFTHARVIDGTGSPVREDVTLVIAHGQIISIGSRSGSSDGQSTKTIDLQGKTIMPGLISDHSHVGLVDGLTTASRNYTRSTILAALDQYVRYGVLTVTSLGLNKSPLFDQLRREQHQGVNPGADLFGVDQGIGAPGGMPPEAMIDNMGRDQIFRPKTPTGSAPGCRSYGR